MDFEMATTKSMENNNKGHQLLNSCNQNGKDETLLTLNDEKYENLAGSGWFFGYGLDPDPTAGSNMQSWKIRWIYCKMCSLQFEWV